MLLGVGTLAIWTYVRFPRLQPASIRGALIHLGVSTVLFNLVPLLIHLTIEAVSRPFSVVISIACITVPAFCYLLTSVIWLLVRLRDGVGSSPRGGHPVSAAGD
jgi:hypothetical protein